MLSSDCTICFATLNRDIDAYVKGAASVGSGGLFPGEATCQCPSLRAVERSDLKTALRATRQSRLELGLQNSPLGRVRDVENNNLQCFEEPTALKKQSRHINQTCSQFFLNPFTSLQFNPPTSLQMKKDARQMFIGANASRKKHTECITEYSCDVLGLVAFESCRRRDAYLLWKITVLV